MRDKDETRAAIDAVPDASAWECLSPMKREHREWVLGQVRRRIAEDGPRRAVVSPDRGRLFMSFAALEGYGEMIRDVEGSVGEWRASGLHPL